MDDQQKIVACSDCFKDQGLRLDAYNISDIDDCLPECPKCGSENGKQLNIGQLEELAHNFFVWGSIYKKKYGAAPKVQFNPYSGTDISLTKDLNQDVSIFEDVLGIGFFYYGPRLWMLGQIEPLKALQQTDSFPKVTKRIINEYPDKTLGQDFPFYRIRKAPKNPCDPNEYDSPPKNIVGQGRFDSINESILYTSPDLETCIHECRVTAEDDLFVATLTPKKPLKLLNLSVLLQEDNIDEFESLDLAVNMLFLAGKHSYEITRKIAKVVKDNGYDGIIYPSYFSLLRLGIMPFRTTLGISIRKIAQYQGIDFNESVPNIAIFGHPIREGILQVSCINRLILNHVQYNYHFGPASV